MKYFLYSLLALFLSCPLYSQSHGNTMIFGYGGGSLSPNDDEFGLNVFTFTNGSLEISDNQESELFFNDTDAAISDTNGNLLFYFNGIDIYNREHKLMDNGGLLNAYNFTGYDLPQGGLILPHPGFVNRYILFHAEEKYVAPWGGINAGVYYSIVDMTENDGLGKVVLRKQPLIIDTLEYGQLAVVRHANGRDWWLTTGELEQNTFYKILIDKNGPGVPQKQAVGTKREYGIGQACFSPDGNNYISFAATGSNGVFPIYLNIYRFDRCTGLFSNPQQFLIPLVSSLGGGIAVSANSQWLYVSLNDALLKYNLLQDPIASSAELVAEYEPFEDPFPTKFLWMFPAPDDKIYIVTTNSSQTLHVIHKPDEPGTSCAFEQHGIHLPCNNNACLPTFADYRLGPLDGSSCDTLGIDNLPVSWWRYEQDRLQHARFEFRDLSYREPASWFWTFGDGFTSNERHPVHEYQISGAYQVCLTVSNDKGNNTHCKTLYSTVAVQDNQNIVNAIRVGPNPFRNHLSISLGVNLSSPVCTIYDQTGKLIMTERLGLGITNIDTHTLAPGMYFWEVTTAGIRIKSGKVVKMER